MSASIATLKALCQAFNDHDLDRIMSFFADDAVLEMPRGPDPWGRRHVGAKAVREGLRPFRGPARCPLRRRQPLCRRRHGHLAMDGERHHEVGERIRARGCDFYTFRGDKVVRRTLLEDRREG